MKSLILFFRGLGIHDASQVVGHIVNGSLVPMVNPIAVEGNVVEVIASRLQQGQRPLPCGQPGGGQLIRESAFFIAFAPSRTSGTHCWMGL